MKARLGLGGYFSSPIDHPVDIIRHAKDTFGIDFFDTSPAYGDSELFFGEALSAYKRISYEICTKTKASNIKQLIADFNKSIMNLRTDYIDIYFGHSFIDDVDTFEKSFNVLEYMAYHLKDEEDVVRKVGVSGHSVEAAIMAIESGLVDVIMIPHSIMYSQFDLVIKFAQSRDIEIITMKNYASGILLGGPEPNKFKEEITIQDIMNFTANNAGADYIIPAARSFDQLNEIYLSYTSSIKLSNSRVNELRNKIKELLGEDFCRSCNECRPCPKYGWVMSQSGILKSIIYHEKFGIDMKDAYNKYKFNYLDCLSSNCNGTCSKLCPFGIDILERMEYAHKLLKE